MNNIEFQTITQLKDKVWTRVFGKVVQDWTMKNCELIADKVELVTDLTIDAKTIQRFSQLTIKDEIEQKVSKDILAMFLVDQKALNKAVDKSIFSNMSKNIGGLENNLSVLAGTYRLYRISRVTGKLINDISVIIRDDCTASFITDMGESFEGTVNFKSANLFCYFANSSEELLLIVYAGIAKTQKFLKYLSCVMNAVGGKIILPYSSASLLVKDNAEPIEIDRINAYFDYFSKGNNIVIDNNAINILDIEIAIEEAKNIAKSKEYIEHLVGNWISYNLASNGEGLHQSRMKIEMNNNVIYNGSTVSYPKGEVKVFGEDVYIYFYGRKNALLTANLQYRDIDKLNSLLVGFTTISAESHLPVLGTAFLIREENLSFSDIEVKFIPNNSSQYNKLKETGIIDRLMEQIQLK